MDADGYLGEVFVSEASIYVIIISCHHVKHLRQKLPKLVRYASFSITGVVDEDIDAVETVIDRIESVRSDCMHENRVNDRENLC